MQTGKNAKGSRAAHAVKSTSVRERRRDVLKLVLADAKAGSDNYVENYQVGRGAE